LTTVEVYITFMRFNEGNMIHVTREEGERERERERERFLLFRGRNRTMTQMMMEKEVALGREKIQQVMNFNHMIYEL
jgi:hypothetical protein